MSGGGDDRTAKKAEYFQKLIALIEEFPKIVVVGADNVGSNQMQKIRQQLRGQGVVLMGKNTMIRKAIRMHLEQKPALEALLPYVRGNMGFIFTKGDLNYVKQRLVENRVGAPAKAGSVAPVDVFVKAGPTGMEPTQTTFLQALNIASKINKGQIEIISDVHLIKAGDKVGQSEATLLAKLSIKPFSYGMSIITVYDNGFIYDPKVLELTDDDILDRFRTGVSNIAQLSLEIGYPTLASLPHSIAGAFKNVVAVALETDVLFPAAQKFKDYLANPGAFASAAPAASSSKAPAAASAPAAAPKKEEPKVEEEEEDMGLGLFD